ncbi:Uncharacterized protein dnm_018680 [Desulfonema magnum]|uniref:Uncharacterized protein n=1 Tax=Desulfonema magnum TaxID=45655 RepID=A0A975BIA3_9BACT|nr:Uncharacterized protein dnm_018680 [Desulfonema magnum]
MQQRNPAFSSTDGGPFWKKKPGFFPGQISKTYGWILNRFFVRSGSKT